jgi:hypothetical protein
MNVGKDNWTIEKQRQRTISVRSIRVPMADESKRSKHGSVRQRMYETVTKNLSGNDGISERFLWLGTAAIIGFLAALLLGLSGVPAPDSALRRDELLPVDAVVFSPRG